MRTRGYLRDCIGNPVSLDELAAATGLGRFWLLRAFQRRFGCDDACLSDSAENGVGTHTTTKRAVGGMDGRRACGIG